MMPGKKRVTVLVLGLIALSGSIAVLGMSVVRVRNLQTTINLPRATACTSSSQCADNQSCVTAYGQCMPLVCLPIPNQPCKDTIASNHTCVAQNKTDGTACQGGTCQAGVCVAAVNCSMSPTNALPTGQMTLRDSKTIAISKTPTNATIVCSSDRQNVVAASTSDGNGTTSCTFNAVALGPAMLKATMSVNGTVCQEVTSNISVNPVTPTCSVTLSQTSISSTDSVRVTTSYTGVGSVQTYVARTDGAAISNANLKDYYKDGSQRQYYLLTNGTKGSNTYTYTLTALPAPTDSGVKYKFWCDADTR